MAEFNVFEFFEAVAVVVLLVMGASKDVISQKIDAKIDMVVMVSAFDKGGTNGSQPLKDAAIRLSTFFEMGVDKTRIGVTFGSPGQALDFTGDPTTYTRAIKAWIPTGPWNNAAGFNAAKGMLQSSGSGGAKILVVFHGGGIDGRSEAQSMRELGIPIYVVTPDRSSPKTEEDIGDVAYDYTGNHSKRIFKTRGNTFENSTVVVEKKLVDAIRSDVTGGMPPTQTPYPQRIDAKIDLVVVLGGKDDISQTLKNSASTIGKLFEMQEDKTRIGITRASAEPGLAHNLTSILFDYEHAVGMWTPKKPFSNPVGFNAAKVMFQSPGSRGAKILLVFHGDAGGAI